MTDESQLIEQILSGEEEGVTTFVRVYGTKLKGFLGYKFPNINHEDREELVQDALIKAIETITEFDPAKGGLGTWLGVIAFNKARTFHRKTTRRDKSDENEEESVNLPLEEIQRQIDKKLTDREREILGWSGEGISQAEMARWLKISKTNVKVIKHRAMKKFREIVLICTGEEERNTDNDLVQKGTGRPNTGSDPSAGL